MMIWNDPTHEQPKRSVQSMTYLHTVTITSILSMAMAAGSACAESTHSDVSVSHAEPHRLVPFTQVQITDDYWAARQKLFICNAIPIGIENVEKERGGIPNIKNAALKNQGKAHGEFKGAFYVDSDVHKVLESMCYALMIDARGDTEILRSQKAIKAKLEAWIPHYVAAQEADGYFHTYFTLEAKGSPEKLSDFDKHEMYCAGHFYEAAVAHFRATHGQDRRLLDVAIKNADFFVTRFGSSPGQYKQVPGHQEIELALIKLANLCTQIGGEDAKRSDGYIKLSKFFLDTRGDYDGRHGKNHNSAYDQDHKRLKDQREAVGHAVRAAYTYIALADVAMQLDTAEYDDTLHAIWDDYTHTKSYVTGAVGVAGYGEGFGPSYFLPNQDSYCETCAQVGGAMWNRRMNLLYGDVKYIDHMERQMYNSVMSCVNFEGTRFFYTNPVSSMGGANRGAWFGTACCPPNIMRFVESLGDTIYTQNDHELAVNMYLGNEARLILGGQEVTIAQQFGEGAQGMPWQCRGRILVSGLAGAADFTLKLRVPVWAKGTELILNGQTLSSETDAHGYVKINRSWHNGDVISLDFKMQTERYYADERVVSNEGLVAVQRGPIVYAAEAVDNPGIRLDRTILPLETRLTVTWCENIKPEQVDPYGIQSGNIIKAPAKVMVKGGLSETQLTLIPYYAWCNREQGSMTIFLREKEVALSFRESAIASASYTSPYDSPGGLNDGGSARWTEFSNTSPRCAWVQYEYEDEVTVRGCQVQWYQDSDGVKIPSSLNIQIWNGTGFVDVKRIGTYDDFTPHQFHQYLFEPVTTTRIRLLPERSHKWVGIKEWRLTGDFVTGQDTLSN
jgi:DUF1680 family protein